MRTTITLGTDRREVLVDITREVQLAVDQSGIREGLVALYAQGATSALMIQENWDDSVQEDVVDLLKRLVPRGVWRHDEQDGNGATLDDMGIPVSHIDENGRIKSQQHVIDIVMPQPSLFDDFNALTSRKKYASSTDSSDDEDDAYADDNPY